MKTFVIGDIHGCYDELLELTKQIGLKDEDMLISLGDIVDRGGKSKEVYGYFLNRPNSKALMGNHERKHLNGVLSYAQEIVKVQFGADYEQFLDWLATLNYYYEHEDAIVVHAFFEHDKALKDQREDVLCGSTSGDRYLENKYAPETYWTQYYEGKKPVIYGHHVVGHYPEIKNNTYGIDTGCCHGDYLTAIELPGFIIHQVKAKKDYWKEEQRLWQVPVLKAKNWDEMSFTDINKQLAKLAYIDEPATVAYLSELRMWKEDLENSYHDVKNDIDRLCRRMIQQHGEDFNQIASRLPFKTFLFKSRADKLTVEDLRQTLYTPGKVIGIKMKLEEQFNLQDE